MSIGVDPVLWTGKPKQGLVLTSRDALMIPFSLVWCGFAVFWTFSATGHGAPTFFTLWGLMFVAIGLYFVVGRFIHDAKIRSKIVYAVTNSGIRISNGSTETIIPVGEWTCLELTVFGDRTGTIRFAPQQSVFGGGSNFGVWVPSMEKTPQFYRIEDPERVLGIIRRLTKPA
jgi:hypothetical protein